MFDKKFRKMLENVGSYLYASWDNYSYIIKENDNEEPENFILYISKGDLPPHDAIYFDEIDEIENRISFIKDEFELYGENDGIIL